MVYPQRLALDCPELVILSRKHCIKLHRYTHVHVFYQPMICILPDTKMTKILTLYAAASKHGIQNSCSDPNSQVYRSSNSTWLINIFLLRYSQSVSSNFTVVCEKILLNQNGRVGTMTMRM